MVIARRIGAHANNRIVVCSLAVLWLVASLANASQQDTFEVVGIVRDGHGNRVGEATVRLQVQGVAATQERKTDSTGGFVFSGLKPGLYVVSASRMDEHSSEVSVTGTRGTIRRLELALPDGPTVTDRGKDDKSGKTAEMEFADMPSFTVAAVTDWTAAGGHGSDTSLRTSEALTRETLRLKSEPRGVASEEHDAAGTERRLRTAQEKSPTNFKANEELGLFYLKTDRYSEAVAPLETAYEADPTDRGNEYELALALDRSGDAAKARAHVVRLLAVGDKPEWQRLAGEVDEKLGDPLAAVHAFERAAKEDPSEENYFAWGAELLQHRAIWQAKSVFESGVKAFPNSSSLLTALGTALFSGALYEEAARRLCEASDLAPNDAEPYLFIGQVAIAAPNPLPCVERKLERFLTLQPTNAQANYYYAMAYWKQRGKGSDAETLSRVEKFLTRAVDADPKYSSAYLQLGVIQESHSDFRNAAEYYRKAIGADPVSTEAHYRLGTVYDRLGEKDKAEAEFKLHDELEKQQAAAVDRQRREVKQFLVLVGANEQDKAAQP